MRNPLVVGNWKMNTTQDEADALVRALRDPLSELASAVDVVVCPPYPWLVDAARVLQGSPIGLGAQNMHTEASGAYTGEVSPRMLKGLCQWVLVGQYERRIYFNDKDAIVRRKLQVAQQHGLRPILCVGENADQLDEGLGPYIVAEQLEANLEGVRLDGDLVIAYDPVWTTMGLVAPPPLDYAEEIVQHIRQTLSDVFAPGVGEQVRVIYAGSVTPRNIAEIAALSTIDGVMAGTASVNADNFTSLVRAFAKRSA
ncbi:MAG TPA: triose-phosphate isomerase [Chloroflexota bacterium]